MRHTLTFAALASLVAAPIAAQAATTNVKTYELVYDTQIRAEVNVSDDGSNDTIRGVGRGFTPGLTYVSFIYGTGSTATGTLACLPPTPNLLTFTQMFQGTWLPVNSSKRTLVQVNTGAAYAPLSSWSTMSVRYDSQAGQPFTVNQSPARYWLQTCSPQYPAPPHFP